MIKFKKWIFKFWKEKDNLVNNNTKYKYIEYNPKLKASNYILVVFCLVLTIHLIIRYKIKYIGITYLLSYLVVIIVTIFNLKFK